MHKWIRVEHSRVNTYMEMVVKVTKIMNDCNICVYTDFNKEIPVSFSTIDEDKININRRYFKEGDTILLSNAKLCLDIWGYEEKTRKYYKI